MRFDEAYPMLERTGLAVFTLADMRAMFPRASARAVAKDLQRWKSRGRISSLKRGVYELRYPRASDVPDFFVANRLYSPSYVSLESALSHYGLVPGVAQAVTSVTSKPTRRFRNGRGLFVYRTLSPARFNGYRIAREGRFSVLLAEPEKALADHLYLKFHRRKAMDLEEERLDWKLVRRLDRGRLATHLRGFGMGMREMDAFL